MMDVFVKLSLQSSRNKLEGWRLRYSVREYPEKVAINTAYELLLLEAMWPWIHRQCFTRRVQYDQFEDAYEFVAGQKILEYISDVRPIVVTTLAQRERLPNLELQQYRQYITRAVDGDPRAQRVLEDTYSIHFASIYLLYTWAGLGLMGYSTDEAIGNVAGVRLGSTERLQDVYTMMNMTVQMHFDNPFELEVFAALLMPPTA